jgi:hypothetical protein
LLDGASCRHIGPIRSGQKSSKVSISFEGRQRIWLWMCHTHSSPPVLLSFVDSCAFLVFSAKPLLARHDRRGVCKKSAVFGGTKVRFLYPLLRKICSHNSTWSWFLTFYNTQGM